MSRTPGHDDERVLENFVDLAGRLISIPVQHKKRLAVLKWLVEDFQPGRLYPESEVNRVISRRHPDFAALRRYLVDEELMQRRRGVYWRTGTMPNVGFDPPSFPDLAVTWGCPVAFPQAQGGHATCPNPSAFSSSPSPSWSLARWP
ncbi:MAG: hypothetical protein AUI87_02565 [Actinobacteria bacterium 13_1_40CM_3_66_19]|nr:MAG: hypothetical protein AUI87_02565 [Actinobacteria bacterium 13_1_40CM_3_66_19]